MKVYFTACARGREEFGGFYERIYRQIKNKGLIHTDNALSKVERKFPQWDYEDKAAEYKKAIECVQKSDFIVLELSIHSLSMGYILHQALELKKPVICLHTKSNMPHFAAVIDNNLLNVFEYNDENLENQVLKGLSFAQSSLRS